MENTSGNKKNREVKKSQKHVCLGILAHVDAGKTTLSESFLFLSGKIRQAGRVDHKDAFLDTYELERERGITIFSKQAVFEWKDMKITLLDTPGHVDFSAEMERTLQVLDYAVLVISGSDGVQGHTMTLWKLLKRYNIPTFLFVNKMDQEGTERRKIMADLERQFGENCIDFSYLDEMAMENLALCDEEMMESYLESGKIDKKLIQKAVKERNVFPCYFGSALYMDGVDELLNGIADFTESLKYPEEFGAKVYKIGRDSQGNRLTYLKVTGGELRVRDSIGNSEEKINEIRIYSGEKYTAVPAVAAGRVCTVTGLSDTYPGEGIGAEPESDLPVLEPVLTYRIALPDACDIHKMLENLRALEEEEPALHIVWEEAVGEIHAQLMGEVQTEVLRHIIRERFGVWVEFVEGNIVYKETIKFPVEGVGHFEPLRHYAEVHLLLEPGERGSGLQFSSVCTEDVLDRNWQRLILTHLEEKEHKGVLVGAGVTDIKITLLAGRAHQKHTEGGDFRQATYRAVRQGLKKAECILLEPYYEFKMELPAEMVGRAMTDIQKMKGDFAPPLTSEESVILTGSAPVSQMRGYQREFISYTKGRGRLFCEPKGYRACQNQEEVVEAIGYDAEADIENPTGSVFCSHGAGFVVPWYQVEEYAHIGSCYTAKKEEREAQRRTFCPPPVSRIELTQEELDAIYVKTPDPIKRNYNATPVTVRAQEKQENEGRRKLRKREQNREEYLLVDGYNIIFAWEDLKELSEISMEAARNKLMDILCNYQGYRKCTLILVFDAYKVEGNKGETIKYHNIHVVYTKEAETADQYIEKTVRRMGRHHDVTVATSDALEQVIILGEGAQRMSAEGLKEEISLAEKEIREEYLGKNTVERNYLFHALKEDAAEAVEKIRLGGSEESSNAK